MLLCRPEPITLYMGMCLFVSVKEEKVIVCGWVQGTFTLNAFLYCNAVQRPESMTKCNDQRFPSSTGLHRGKKLTILFRALWSTQI